MKELAKKLAEALQRYGTLPVGTWEQRKEALVNAIREVDGPGVVEVLSWFDVDTSELEF